MSRALGSISLTGLLTCNLCDWSEWQHADSALTSEVRSEHPCRTPQTLRDQ